MAAAVSNFTEAVAVRCNFPQPMLSTICEAYLCSCYVVVSPALPRRSTDPGFFWSAIGKLKAKLLHLVRLARRQPGVRASNRHRNVRKPSGQNRPNQEKVRDCQEGLEGQAVSTWTKEARTPAPAMHLGPHASINPTIHIHTEMRLGRQKPCLRYLF